MFIRVTYFSVDLNNELSKEKYLEMPFGEKKKPHTHKTPTTHMHPPSKKQTTPPQKTTNQQLHYSES